MNEVAIRKEDCKISTVNLPKVHSESTDSLDKLIEFDFQPTLPIGDDDQELMSKGHASSMDKRHITEAPNIVSRL